MNKTEKSQSTFKKTFKNAFYAMCLQGQSLEHGVVVGLSGGPDSVCLLHLLTGILPQDKIVAVHINHLLRDAAAQEDAIFCATLCKALQVELVVLEVKIAQLAKRKKIGIEECGRIERYRLFEEVRAARGFDFIAVAHNFNDQAETILMNIARGSGIDGLKGMEYRRERIIRPLLGCRREAIEAYLAHENILARTDSSNFSNDYTRNRVRHELLPKLNELFDKDVRQQLVQLGHLAAMDANFLASITEKEFDRICQSSDETQVHLDAKQLLALDQAIATRVLRKAIDCLAKGRKDFSFAHVEAILKLLETGVSGKKLALPGGLEAFYAYDIVTIRKKSVSPKAKQLPEMLVAIPGVTTFGHLEFIVTSVKKTEAASQSESKNVIFVDKCKLNGNLVVRNRRNGDIINPFHSIGTKKLKAYLIDQKIPQQTRDALVFLACENEIVWLVGDVKSKKFSDLHALDASHEVLKIEVKEID
ncbi:MAG: tRNA lysidine(34) synthetase TilS [Clostridia bacterium]